MTGNDMNTELYAKIVRGVPEWFYKNGRNKFQCVSWLTAASLFNFPDSYGWRGTLTTPFMAYRE